MTLTYLNDAQADLLAEQLWHQPSGHPIASSRWMSRIGAVPAATYVVDRWPDYGACFCFGEGYAERFDILVYANDLSALDRLVEAATREKVIPWQERAVDFLVTDTHSNTVRTDSAQSESSVIQRHASNQHGLQLVDGSLDSIRQLTLDAKDLKAPAGELPGSLHFVPWRTIADTHFPGGQYHMRSRSFTRLMMLGLPGAALQDSDEQVAAYAGLYPWGELGMAHTAQKWRGRGLCGRVVAHLAVEQFERNACPQMITHVHNATIVSALKRIGFRDSGLDANFLFYRPVGESFDGSNV